MPPIPPQARTVCVPPSPRMVPSLSYLVRNLRTTLALPQPVSLQILLPTLPRGSSGGSVVGSGSGQVTPLLHCTLQVQSILLVPSRILLPSLSALPPLTFMFTYLFYCLLMPLRHFITAASTCLFLSLDCKHLQPSDKA